MANKKPSLRQLEYFIAIAECDSFRKAAERLDISQPTITAQIAGLEGVLGVKLFERMHSGARLSAAGRTLLPSARAVLEQVGGFVEAADEISNRPGGTFRLGATPTLGPYLLPHVLPDLHQQYPNLKFHVREDVPTGLEDGLIDGRHDLVLSPMPLNDQDFFVQPLFREPVQLVVSSDDPLARRDKVKAVDLAGAGILTMEEHHRFHSQVEQLCQRLGARLLRDYHGTSLDALRHMVVMGLGHAFLPALYTLSEIHAQSDLRVLEIEDESIYRVHALAWRKTAPTRSFFHDLANGMREIVKQRLPKVVTAVE